MTFLTRALILVFLVACVGVAFVSVSRLRISEGSHDLLTFGSGVIGIVLLVLAAKIFQAALTAAKTN